MFKRLSYEEWQSMAPIIAFLLTFAVFLFQVVRALCIKKDQSERLARLPLEDNLSSSNTHDENHSTPATRKP
jgi:hypothetical protein